MGDWPRDLPAEIAGYGAVRSFQAQAPERAVLVERDRGRKLLPSLEAALDACDVRDGATLSFHHHLRNGDHVLNEVMAAVARRGIKNIHVAASSIFPVHAPLVDHMESGTVSRISATFISGPVGEAISRGRLAFPAVMRTHGGRARALEAGELPIDVAFVAAPAADPAGNISGQLGEQACGTLGYPMVDVRVARRVVAVTDTLMDYPLHAVDISQENVDHVVEIPQIGNASGILSGITRPAEDLASRAIGQTAAEIAVAAGLVRDGFAFQTGAGGISLVSASCIAEKMAAAGVLGSFMAGGITGMHVGMLQAGLFRGIFDVQCFDLDAARSYRDDPRHRAMSASLYANPDCRSPVVDQLDCVILGAAEVDFDFNVNVTTRSDGTIMGGSGGHADTAAGAHVSIVTTRLTAGPIPKIVERVRTITTPGSTVDVVVTEAGIAVNPRRSDLREQLLRASLPVVEIADLYLRAREAAPPRSVPEEREGKDAPVVGVLEYRDGSVTDVTRRV